MELSVSLAEVQFLRLHFYCFYSLLTNLSM